MPKNNKQETSLHEVATWLAGFEQPLITYLDAKEAERLSSILESDSTKPPSFYEFDLLDGLGCLINLTHVTRIDVTDFLGGIPFKKPHARKPKQVERNLIEREQSDDTVILRVWMSGKRTTEIFREIEYEEWSLLSALFDDAGQTFVGFMDAEEERVILPISRICAIECFDTHYLSDTDIEQQLNERA